MPETKCIVLKIALNLLTAVSDTLEAKQAFVDENIDLVSWVWNNIESVDIEEVIE